ncbi:MAG: hydrolase [Alphaproteobacteria bacterium HGW-Alphaproteobacteria-6]|nr:MAG: hydrolase [Alphaproteobacteria bacterium HGW-Alphaproteobacteria-6]
MIDTDIDLVIFDCDGVLIDSEVISARVLIAALARSGVIVDFDHFRNHFLGRSFPTVARQVREDFRVALPDDFEAAYRAELLAAFGHELHPTPGVARVLDRLAVGKCVATSSSPPRVARSLALTGLAGYFGSAVFTASEVAQGKPAPDLFLHVAARMGVAPGRCLVIEDSVTGIRAALAAGMPVLRYTGGGHLAGLQPATDAADPLAGVPAFSVWDMFFQMLPALEVRPGAAAGEGTDADGGTIGG